LILVKAARGAAGQRFAMTRQIAIIDGHPDPDPGRLVHALADAYAGGAAEAGHRLRRIDVARLDFPTLRTKDDWAEGTAPADIRDAQSAIAWAEHLVFLYPLWLGSMPALLKAFLEQAFRPGFALKPKLDSLRVGLLTGKSARIVVTMGMPALAYRWYFRAHSLKSLERNILRFSGIGPIRDTLIGGVEADQRARAKWIEKLRALGRAGR
jgi:putative NADPH-quinone reductase